MSTTHAQRPGGESAPRSGHERRRADLDHDLVAVVAMLAILALTGLCLLGGSLLPL